MSGDVLAGARLAVLDLTVSVAGGFCAGLLARMGTGVSRIELSPKRGGANPELDLYIHCGKTRSSLDVDAPGDRALLDRLAGRADVIVLDSPLGVDLAEPGEGQARVIVAVQGSLGADSDADRRARDVSLWAESGLLDLARGTTGEPVLPPGFQASYLVGLHAAVGAMAAVVEARVTGESASIEIEASEVLSSLLLPSGALDRDGEPAGSDEPGIGDSRPSWLVETADGDVFLNANSVYAADLLAFARGWKLIDGEAAAGDFGSSAARELQGWSRAQLVERAQEWRLPAGAVLSLEELEQDEQIRHRGTLVSVDDRHLGTVQMPWLPWTETEPAG